MAGYYGHTAGSMYTCVDGNPDTLHGGKADKNGRLFYLVEARCGSLKCPPYVEGREIVCTVCSKEWIKISSMGFGFSYFTYIRFFVNIIQKFHYWLLYLFTFWEVKILRKQKLCRIRQKSGKTVGALTEALAQNTKTISHGIQQETWPLYNRIKKNYTIKIIYYTLTVYILYTEIKESNEQFRIWKKLHYWKNNQWNKEKTYNI